MCSSWISRRLCSRAGRFQLSFFSLTLFCLSSQAGTFTLLHSFSDTGDGANPFASVIQGSDGLFYGTTAGLFHGTVYSIDSTGQLITIYPFTGLHNGAKSPRAKLLQDSEGNFYGTTAEGGGTTRGTVFKLTAEGVETILHVFDQTDGQNPTAGLTIGPDGAFYGVTPRSGLQFGKGTIFRITSDGQYAMLHLFTGGDGATPLGELLLGQDGNLYGTTLSGGSSDLGTIFKITSAGLFNVVHDFAGSDGASPLAGLIQTSDGNFYGTAGGRGDFGYGTIYKISPVGVLTTLHSFTATEGDPQAPLIQANDGNFYGTTISGGTDDYGTVFQLTPLGGFTTVYSFGYTDGASPVAGVVQGSDGDLYGTTLQGGAYELGTVFRLTLPATPPPPPPPPPPPSPQRLLNISTRAGVGSDDDIAIGGFIVTGSTSKNILVRGIGPSLTAAGIQEALPDPMLQLVDQSEGTIVESNDNWRDTQEAEIVASGLAPTGDLESAMLVTLAPGAYTALLQDINGSSGVGLIEIYDLDETEGSQLANISTRAFVDTGDNVLIGGVIIGGGAGQALVRAIGPSLPLTGKLADPTLDLYDTNGVLLASNDNWRDSQEAEITATMIPPTDDAESAILPTLAPGAYTAIVRGKDGTTGVALVEVYAL